MIVFLQENPKENACRFLNKTLNNPHPLNLDIAPALLFC
jgi:hypothetical protein